MNGLLARPGNLPRENALHWFACAVAQVTVDRERCGRQRRKGQISCNVRIADLHSSGAAEINALPDSRISIGNERNIEFVLRVLKSDVFPIDPVQPTVGEFD